MARTKVVKRQLKQGKQPEELPSDMEDEVDKYHKQRTKLTFEPSSEESSGEAEDEGVFDLSEDESSADIDADSKLGKLVHQERLLRERLKLAQGEDVDEADAAEETAQPDRRWGTGKRPYYGADNMDYELTDDEDAPAEEEEEARRLQREHAAALAPEDYDLPSSASPRTSQHSDSMEEQEEGLPRKAPDTMGAAAARQAGPGPAGRPGGRVAVEEVEREAGSPGAADIHAAEAVARDAPELAALAADLASSLTDVRTRVGPLLREVRCGGLATAGGVSYLEAKHLLLLHYCMAITFYLLLRAEGRSVRDHPVIARLVQLRSYLDKLRPLDRKLAYQVDKLLAAAQAIQADQAAGTADDGAAGDANPLSFAPRPDKLVTRAAPAQPRSSEPDQAGGVYRPPRLNPVAMEDDPDRDYAAKERRRARAAAQRSARSSLIQELAQEVAGAPEEVHTRAEGLDTAAALRMRQRLEARAAVEEDLMARVPLAAQERRRLKAQRRAGMAGGALLDDFADDVADLVQATEGLQGASGANNPLEDMAARHRLSQKYGVDLSSAARKNLRGGDDDLPARQPLVERRARMDEKRSREAVNEQGAGGDEQGPEGEEDTFYRQAKDTMHRRKQAKVDKYAPKPLHPPLEDPVTAGARKINYAIDKNRGLTPHRRKDIKNPRVKGRMKFDKAKKRRAGQVQEVQPSGPAYGGEGTGIKSHVVKSRRF